MKRLIHALQLIGVALKVITYIQQLLQQNSEYISSLMSYLM